MVQCTLVLCIKEDMVLLAQKRRGFGAGKWNGFGGKARTEETVIQAAMRELTEESGLVVTNKNNLGRVARITFYTDNMPCFMCEVFLVRKWLGYPSESEEMVLPTWYNISKLPLAEMFPGDRIWFPRILRGEKLQGDIFYNSDLSVVERYDLKPL